MASRESRRTLPGREQRVVAIIFEAVNLGLGVRHDIVGGLHAVRENGPSL